MRDNPLGDRASRPAAVFSPNDTPPGEPLPLVLYLPGWGGSSVDAIREGQSGWLGQVVDHLAAEGEALRLVVPDSRSRYGGTQYLNSTATGQYADYTAEEVVGAVNARYALAKDAPVGLIVAGHSSGGYGALLLGIARHERFQAIVALSPDSDFATTHKPMTEQPSVLALTPADLGRAMAPAGSARIPKDGLAAYILGLCANYAPCLDEPGRCEWLYTADGQWRPEVWQRWLDVDPLVIAQRHTDAFAPSQRIYLDGAAHDEYGANIGARKIFDTIRNRLASAAFYEPPGAHVDHLPERLARGLEWVFGLPTCDIGAK